jgi:hypothetical protein
MGKYLDIFRSAEHPTPAADQPHSGYDKNDINDKRYTDAFNKPKAHNQRDAFGRLCRFCRTLDELERRCPDHVDAADWQQAIEDGRRFEAEWGSKAQALGWTDADLSQLHEPPQRPHPSYRRLSRYDCTGLIWLLQGRPVIELTETTATIRAHSGATLTYRKIKTGAS